MITLDPELLDILACPSCRSSLRVETASDGLACTNPACGLVYPVRDEIPVLLVDEATGGPAEHQERNDNEALADGDRDDQAT